MSAHEEKISGKRRKLFKALSAAPVVMTLRPGGALANDSAFQCATKIADPLLDPNLTDFGPTPPPTQDFVFQEYDYFRLNGRIPDECTLSSLRGETVVYIDGSLYRTASPGVGITTGYVYNAGTGGSAGTLTLLDGAGGECGTTVNGNIGKFALFDSVQDDGQFTGVAFPKADPLGPDMQGITGTCMASINGIATRQSLIG